MITIEKIARAALDGQSLELRSLCQDFIAQTDNLADCSPPATDDVQVMAAAASLIELLALHAGQCPPGWAKSIGPLAQPVYLVKAASSMKRLRILCEQESPEPLRKRGFFAPPDFLASA